MPEITTALSWRSLTALLSCAWTGLRPPKALATAPFAHVPVNLGRVPIYVERLVAMSHDIGVRVVTWTVDEPVVIRRLLDSGVDAIITDRPDVLREVLIQRGAWQPPGRPMHFCSVRAAPIRQGRPRTRPDAKITVPRLVPGG